MPVAFPCMLLILAPALLTPAGPAAVGQVNIAGHVMEMQDEMPRISFLVEPGLRPFIVRAKGIIYVPPLR
jgi:hypothetical protein